MPNLPLFDDNPGAPVSRSKRRPLFRRDPGFQSRNGRAGHFELKRRDLDMIEAVARHRFLNTQQICAVFACACPRIARLGVRGGRPSPILVKRHRPNCACTCGLGSTTRDHAASCPALFKDDLHCIGRARELFHAGYLGRPLGQLHLRIANGIAAGSAPMVYCVTSAGLTALGDARRARLGERKLSYVHKINQETRLFIEHTLAIADVSIGLDLALRRRPDLRRVSERALMAGMTPERRASAQAWGMHCIYDNTPLTAVCDLALSVEDTKAQKFFNFLVEVDRGHMPIERRDMDKTSVLRKLVAYAEAYKNGEHKTAFAWKRCRVVILTTSPARVASCAAAALRAFGTDAIARIFLFGTLAAADDLLNYEFTGADGGPVRLLD